jgi:hypothetical protein
MQENILIKVLAYVPNAQLELIHIEALLNALNAQ